MGADIASGKERMSFGSYAWILDTYQQGEKENYPDLFSVIDERYHRNILTFRSFSTGVGI